MLSEKTIIDQITVTDSNYILVREKTTILRDEQEIYSTYHRSSYSPLDDVSECDQKIKDIAAIIWTDEVKEAYRQTIAEALG